MRLLLRRNPPGLRLQSSQLSRKARAENAGARRPWLRNLAAPKRAGNGTSDARKGRFNIFDAQRRARRSDGRGPKGSQRTGGLRGGGEFPKSPRQHGAGGALPARWRGNARTISLSAESGAPSRFDILLLGGGGPQAAQRSARRGRRTGGPTLRRSSGKVRSAHTRPSRQGRRRHRYHVLPCAGGRLPQVARKGKDRRNKPLDRRRREWRVDVDEGSVDVGEGSVDVDGGSVDVDEGSVDVVEALDVGAAEERQERRQSG